MEPVYPVEELTVLALESLEVRSYQLLEVLEHTALCAVILAPHKL